MNPKYLNKFAENQADTQKEYKGTQKELEEIDKKKQADLKLITLDLNPISVGDQSPTSHPVTHKVGDKSPTMGDTEKVGDSPKMGDKSPKDESNFDSRTQRHKMGIRISNHKYKQYQMWCVLNNITLQSAVELAMDRLLGDINFVGDKSPSHPVDHDLDRSDDLIDDKLSSIMEFYAHWTGNKIKEADKYTYQDVSQYDTTVIKAGILMTIARAKDKIGSFKYCTYAIEEAAKKKVDESYIKYLIEFIQKKKTTVK